MAQEIEKLLGKGGPPDEETSTKDSEDNKPQPTSEEFSEPTVEITCPKCKEDFDIPLSKLFLVSDTQVSAVCPKCGLTLLNKKDSERVIEAFKRHGVYEQKLAQKSKKKDVEEEITDFELLKRLIDQSFDGLKISEQDKIEIVEWFSMYEGMIQDWFSPNIIQWVTAYIDFMLKQRSYSQKTVTKAVGRLNSKMQLEMARRQREMAITGLFQNAGMFMQPQQQPGQPMMSPALPTPPQMGFIPGMQQMFPPGMQPPGVQTPQQPGQPQQPFQQPQTQPQQISPEVMKLMEEIKELKSQLARERASAEEGEEIIEEVLDESGKPIKRIIKTKGSKKFEKSPQEMVTDTIAMLKDLGVLKSPAELYAELKSAGVLPDMNVIKEMIESVAQRQPESPIDAFAPSTTDEIDRLREEIEALRTQLQEEKTSRLLAEIKSEYDEKLKSYELMLENMKKEIEHKRYEGKPESVQELEIRKDTLKEIGEDLKDMFKTIFDGLVVPMAEMQRMDRLMMIKMQEEAGQLPKGTLERILSKPEKVDKERIEDVKEKLKKIRKK